MELAGVLRTSDLVGRVARPPDYAAENRALCALARHLATSPETILHHLAEAAFELCRAHSAGLSLIEEENGRAVFRWPAIVGAFAGHVWGTQPRSSSPCGVVVDTRSVQLFEWPCRFYPDLDGLNPPIVEALLQPFSVEGETVGTIWVMAHDESRKFDAEDARALGTLAAFAANAYQVLSSLRRIADLDRRKDEFMDWISHEIRSPVQAMDNWMRLAFAPGASEEVRARAASGIGRASHSLARLADDLLEVSRIAAGKVSVELENAELGEIVREAAEANASAIAGAGLALSLRAGTAVPVRVDPTRIRQVVDNLLSNAIKFTPPGGRIDVEVCIRDDAAEVTVTDSGNGIPSHLLPWIFERYQQGDTSSADRRGGLGLGLAIAAELVELHGGTIEAASAGVGTGSTFRVRLPRILRCSTPDVTAA